MIYPEGYDPLWDLHEVSSDTDSSIFDLDAVFPSSSQTKKRKAGAITIYTSSEMVTSFLILMRI